MHFPFILFALLDIFSTHILMQFHDKWIQALNIFVESDLWIIKSNDTLTQRVLPATQNLSLATQAPLSRKSLPFLIYVARKEMDTF